MPFVQYLRLDGNQIGDVGISAFAEAVRSGALAQLQELWLNSNSIGDVGMKAFADAVRKGALDKLEKLYLHENKIGDAGMSALAVACASGTLPALKNLAVEYPWHSALKAACAARGIRFMFACILRRAESPL